MAASPLIDLSKSEKPRNSSYGTFSGSSQNNSRTNLREANNNNSNKTTADEFQDTTFDKCWRQCERVLMYFSAATVDKELEKLELENNNR